jgi:hypothetical protein
MSHFFAIVSILTEPDTFDFEIVRPILFASLRCYITWVNLLALASVSNILGTTCLLSLRS